MVTNKNIVPLYVFVFYGSAIHALTHWTLNKIKLLDVTFEEKQCSSFLIAVINYCRLNINYLLCSKLSNPQCNSPDAVLITQRLLSSACG